MPDSGLGIIFDFDAWFDSLSLEAQREALARLVAFAQDLDAGLVAGSSVCNKSLAAHDPQGLLAGIGSHIALN